MAALLRLAALAVLCAAAGARAQFAEERAPRYIASAPASQNKPAPPPPVAILKQINRHNEDGSYTYGFESADGSFKIETKSPTGEVKGKYGYKDDTGKLRVVEYGANKHGFQPAGEGITVAPPTLVDESAHEEESRSSKSQGSRNQYRAPVQAAPTPDYDYEEPAPAPRPAPRPAPQQHFRQQQYRPAPQAAPSPPKPAFFPGAAPAPAPLEEQSFFRPAAAPRKQDFRPAPQLQNQNFAPAPAPRPQVEYSQQYEQPAEPRFPQAPQPRFAPAQQQQPQYQHTFSMLDQLLKEYALPQGGSSPTHDITFGSY